MAARKKAAEPAAGKRIYGGSSGGHSASSVLPATGTAGAPVAGTWPIDQLAVDSANRIWLCTAGGTPGTWALLLGVGPVWQSATVATQETTTSTTYADTTTPGPSVTLVVPASGVVVVSLKSFIANSTVSDYALASFAISGATTQAASDSTCLSFVAAAASQGGDLGTGIFPISGLTPGSTTFKMQLRCTAGQASWARRTIYVETRP